MHRSILILLAFCVLPASPAAAQSISRLQPGDQVRIRADDVSGRFTVLETRGDSLVLRPTTRYGEVRLPLASIERIDLSHGPRGRLDGALRTGGRGIVIGAAGGVILALLAGADENPDGLFAFSLEDKVFLYGTGFGLIGGGAGAIGGAIAPGQRWKRIVPPSGLRIAPASGGGVRLGLTRRF